MLRAFVAHLTSGLVYEPWRNVSLLVNLICLKGSIPESGGEGAAFK